MKNHFNHYINYNSLFIVSIKKGFTFLLAILIFSIFLLQNNSIVNAMTPKCHSYDAIYKALPSNLQKSDFIYTSNGITLLAFCEYKSSGSDYKTSMKYSSDNLYYCVNYQNHFTADKAYVASSTMYDDELRARIGLAMQLGTSKWNTNANKGYTTGNFVTDYYMTQIVIHALIYKYGGSKSDQGVDFNSLIFKNGTGNLKTKTTNLYKACCNATFKSKNGNFQNAVFSFQKPSREYILFDEDKNAFVSEDLGCDIDDDNGEVTSFVRESNLSSLYGEVFSYNTIINYDDTYNSQYSFFVPLEQVDNLEPGVYKAEVHQVNVFNRAFAKIWSCSEEKHKDNQEVSGLSYADTQVVDSQHVKLFVGECYIKKTDSISGEIIPDAEFQLYQYNNETKKYEYLRDFIPKENKYYSGKIYCSIHNPDRKFKVIESKPGKNYINDWSGQEFTFTDESPVYEFDVENAPILGNLHLKKEGEDIEFDQNNKSYIISTNNIRIPNVSFSLYAGEDIFLKEKLIYKKDQKIIDFKTDNKGEAEINSLLPGRYYFKENETNKLYVLKNDRIDFFIEYHNNQYTSFDYTMLNKLKKCSLDIYKYTVPLNSDDETSDDETSVDKTSADKIPLEGCKFGIYVKNDVYNPAGKIIIKKDTLINKGITDKDGHIKFKDLYYTDYYLKELEVPDGIVINQENIDISKEKFELSAGTTESYNAEIHICNNKQEYRIKLYKYGEQFVKADNITESYGSYFKYILDNRPLKNVTFSLYDKMGNFIESKVTDDNGYIQFDSLEYGEYVCKEENAPALYEINNEPIIINCNELIPNDSKSDDDSVIEINQNMYDKMCGFSLKIKKTGEIPYIKDNKIEYQLEPLEGVVYGIFQDFDYNFMSNEKLVKDSCVGYLCTNSDGIANFKGFLPEGKYYLKELKTLKGYEIDQNRHSFLLKSNANKTINIDLSTEPFENYMSKSSVKIIKTDENTAKKLKGVEFTLYNDKDEKIGTYKTNRKGEITVDNLPYGNYYFVETKSLNGYYSSNNKYTFTIDSKIIKVLEISNIPILKLGFEENYKMYISVLLAIITACIVLITSRKII